MLAQESETTLPCFQGNGWGEKLRRLKILEVEFFFFNVDNAAEVLPWDTLYVQSPSGSM